MSIDLFSAGFGALIAVLPTLVNQRYQRKREAERADAAYKLEIAKTALGNVARADERRAEVAAEALGATLRFLDALKWTASARLDPRRGAANVDGAIVDGAIEEEIEEHGRILKRLERYERKFHLAWERAQIYLPEHVAEALEQAVDLKLEIMVMQIAYNVTVASGDVKPNFFEEMRRAAFGDEPQGKIAALRAELKALLRPMASLR